MSPSAPAKSRGVDEHGDDDEREQGRSVDLAERLLEVVALVVTLERVVAERILQRIVAEGVVERIVVAWVEAHDRS
ncbi:hypothetical protein ACFO5R_14970 [Halosolutus amylolyticus]|uniref:Uncharacterized protein n=1 Tax=Halosolutus amylolyticus TaxID=2932267 RepID=A0ABD5PSF2_9EURY